MRIWFPLAAMVAALPVLAAETDVTLPSGRTVSPHEVIHDEIRDTIRYRFLEPGLVRALEDSDAEALEADMRYLCEGYALALIEALPAQIVISIADRPVEFGANDPDATQVFEAYRPKGGTCVWEAF